MLIHHLTTYTDSEKAEILQKQFISAFTHEPSGDPPPFPERCAQILSTRITEEMVMKEINELDENKSIGPDEIHAKMLKELKEYIVINHIRMKMGLNGSVEKVRPTTRVV